MRARTRAGELIEIETENNWRDTDLRYLSRPPCIYVHGVLHVFFDTENTHPYLPIYAPPPNAVVVKEENG